MRRKITAGILVCVMLLSACFVNTSASTSVIAYQDFEGYTDVLPSPWENRQPVPLAEMGKGKSAVITSTPSAMQEAKYLFTAVDSNISGALITFSAYFADFNADRAVYMRNNELELPIVQMKKDKCIHINDIKISDTKLEAGKWYDFFVEYNVDNAYTSVSVYDNGTEVLSGSGAVKKTGVKSFWRLAFISFAGDKEATMYADNLSLYGVQYSIAPYTAVDSTETFQSFVASSDGQTVPDGWRKQAGTPDPLMLGTKEENNDKSLSVTTDGKAWFELIKSFDSLTGEVVMEFDLQRENNSGIWFGVRGTGVSAKFFMQITPDGDVNISSKGSITQHGSEKAGTMAANTWYHYTVVFNTNDKTYSFTAQNSDATLSLSGSGSMYADLRDLSAFELYSPNLDTGASTIYIDNLYIGRKQSFGVTHFSKRFGYLEENEREVSFTFNSDVNISGASFYANGSDSLIKSTRADKNTVTVELADTLPENTAFVLTAEGVKSAKGEVINPACVVMTKPSYEISDFAISSDGSKVSARAKILTNSRQYDKAALVLVLKNSDGKTVGGSFDEIALSSRYATASAEVTLPDASGSYVAYAYIWDSIYSMNSLAAAKKLDFSGNTQSGGAVLPDGISFDPSTQYLTVTGESASASNKRVALQVLNPGVTQEDVASVTNADFTDIFADISETTADKDGIYAFDKIKIDGKSGSYSLRCTVSGSEPVYTPKAFTFISPSLEADILGVVKSDGAQPSDIDGALCENAEVLGLENYASLSGEERLKVIALLDKDCQSVDDVKTNVNLALFVHDINNAADASAAAAAADAYSASLGAKCSTYSLYQKLSQNGKLAVGTALLSSAPYTSADDAIAVLGNYAVFAAVDEAENYSQIEPIVRTSEKWFGADFSSYLNLSNKKNAGIAIMSASYTNAKAFVDAVNRSVTAGSSSSQSGGGVSGKVSGGMSQTVSIAPVETAAPSDNAADQTPVFADLASAQWAKEAIEALAQKGIVNGKTASAFEPLSNVTREEFAKMLVAAFGSVDPSDTSLFTDCPGTHWASPYVAAAYEAGLVKGISDSEFGVGMNITRQDIALMLWRVLSQKGIEAAGAASQFADSGDISEYAKAAVDAMVQMGIISGMGDGTFAPQAPATRAQAAKLIYETMRKAGL